MHWYLVITPLLAGGDEGASFFTNFYHIQTHRRTRALRRLNEFLDAGVLSSPTLVVMFVPVVEYYVAPTTTFDHLLVAEAIGTLGTTTLHAASRHTSASATRNFALPPVLVSQEENGSPWVARIIKCTFGICRVEKLCRHWMGIRVRLKLVSDSCLML